MSDIAIKVENLSKKYFLGTAASGNLRDTLANGWGQLMSKTKKEEQKEFWALKDVSFEVKKGEVIGVIGRNGAGKSTLLKILSRITEPTSGRVELNGRVASLLEVGTGFHPELSGRENIFLNGALLGMTRAEIKQKFDEIIDFSGVEEFIDTPVKKYSSGMYVRLAFAVAAHLEPEILLVDEVLAVGDAEFQKKCLGKMDEVAKGGRTVVFVSHNMGAVSNLCQKGMLLQNGNKVISGKISEVIADYQNTNTFAAVFKRPEILSNHINSIQLQSKKGTQTSSFLFNEKIIIKVNFACSFSSVGMMLSFYVKNNLNNKVFTSEIEIIKIQNTQSVEKSVQIAIPDSILAPGGYHISFVLHIPNRKIFDHLEDIVNFEILDIGNILSKYKNTFLGDVIIDCKYK
jgi:lipopolysaccharide transport system ATP-binding protein